MLCPNTAATGGGLLPVGKWGGGGGGPTGVAGGGPVRCCKHAGGPLGGALAGGNTPGNCCIAALLGADWGGALEGPAPPGM